MNIIGFTGTRNGMTDEQKRAVVDLVLLLSKGIGPEVKALHGDCIGADVDFNDICGELGIACECRPCTLRDYRAYCCVKEIAPPEPPMQRNRKIVADATVMIACPPNFEPIKRGSGTWATIGFAEKARKPLCIVYPDGKVERRN